MRYKLLSGLVLCLVFFHAQLSFANSDTQEQFLLGTWQGDGKIWIIKEINPGYYNRYFIVGDTSDPLDMFKMVKAGAKPISLHYIDGNGEEVIYTHAYVLGNQMKLHHNLKPQQEEMVVEGNRMYTKKSVDYQEWIDVKINYALDRKKITLDAEVWRYRSNYDMTMGNTLMGRQDNSISEMYFSHKFTFVPEGVSVPKLKEPTYKTAQGAHQDELP